jgi:hypothetical protein
VTTIQIQKKALRKKKALRGRRMKKTMKTRIS